MKQVHHEVPQRSRTPRVGRGQLLRGWRRVLAPVWLLGGCALGARLVPPAEVLLSAPSCSRVIETMCANRRAESPAEVPPAAPGTCSATVRMQAASLIALLRAGGALEPAEGRRQPDGCLRRTYGIVTRNGCSPMRMRALFSRVRRPSMRTNVPFELRRSSTK